MAFALDDMVRESSTTTGTGTFDLDGAVDGFQTFVAGIGNTNTTHYSIINRNAAEWEVGLATITDAAPDTLARTTVFSSSNGDAAVNFSAGTKDVICTRAALQLAAKSLKLAPEVEQSITAVTDTLSSSGAHLGITPDADYVLTSTPTITAGEDGQILLIHNAHSSFTLTLQDDSILSGSDVLLGGASGTIKPQSTMTLHYCADLSAWSVIANPNTASAGANATLIPVRNTSGGSIAAGAPAYITGYNVGQGRITIDEADGDDLAKLPAFGVLATALGNNTNGEVITSGVATGIINTNPGGTAVGDGVWVSTTAGELVFDRPTTGYIQRIGTIARVHASQGVVNIFGAGRVNDTPLAITVSSINLGDEDLDTYDEGTWTPTLEAVGGGGFTDVTYTALRGGTYTQIGDIMHLDFSMRTASITVGSASSSVFIGGAPVNAAGTPSGRAVSISFVSGFAGDFPSSAYISSGSPNKITLEYRTTSNTTTIALAVADVDTGANKNTMYLSATYKTV